MPKKKKVDNGTMILNEPYTVTWIRNILTYLNSSNDDAVPESIENAINTMRQELTEWVVTFFDQMNVPVVHNERNVIFKDSTDFKITWAGIGYIAFTNLYSGGYESTILTIDAPVFDTTSAEVNELEERARIIRLENLTENLNDMIRQYMGELMRIFGRYSFVEMSNSSQLKDRFLIGAYLKQRLLNTPAENKLKKIVTLRDSAVKLKNTLQELPTQYTRANEMRAVLKDMILKKTLEEIPLYADMTRYVVQTVEDILVNAHNNDYNLPEWSQTEGEIAKIMLGARNDQHRWLDDHNVVIKKHTEDILRDYKDLIITTSCPDFDRIVGNPNSENNEHKKAFSDHFGIPCDKATYGSKITNHEQEEWWKQYTYDVRTIADDLANMFPEFLKLRHDNRYTPTYYNYSVSRQIYTMVTPLAQIRESTESLYNQYQILISELFLPDTSGRSKPWQAGIEQQTYLDKHQLTLHLPTEEFIQAIDEMCAKPAKDDYRYIGDLADKFDELQSQLPVALTMTDGQLMFKRGHHLGPKTDIGRAYSYGAFLNASTFGNAIYEMQKPLVHKYLRTKKIDTAAVEKAVDTLIERTIPSTQEEFERKLQFDALQTPAGEPGEFITPDTPMYKNQANYELEMLTKLIDNLNAFEEALLKSDNIDFIEWCTQERFIDKKAGKARIAELEAEESDTTEVISNGQ